MSSVHISPRFLVHTRQRVSLLHLVGNARSAIAYHARRKGRRAPAHLTCPPECFPLVVGWTETGHAVRAPRPAHEKNSFALTVMISSFPTPHPRLSVINDCNGCFASNPSTAKPFSASMCDGPHLFTIFCSFLFPFLPNSFLHGRRPVSQRRL